MSKLFLGLLLLGGGLLVGVRFRDYPAFTMKISRLSGSGVIVAAFTLLFIFGGAGEKSSASVVDASQTRAVQAQASAPAGPAVRKAHAADIIPRELQGWWGAGGPCFVWFDGNTVGNPNLGYHSDIVRVEVAGNTYRLFQANGDYNTYQRMSDDFMIGEEVMSEGNIIAQSNPMRRCNP